MTVGIPATGSAGLCARFSIVPPGFHALIQISVMSSSMIVLESVNAGRPWALNASQMA